MDALGLAPKAKSPQTVIPPTEDLVDIVNGFLILGCGLHGIGHRSGSAQDPPGMSGVAARMRSVSHQRHVKDAEA